MSITLVSQRVHRCYSQRNVLREAPMLPVESDLRDISQWNWSKLRIAMRVGDFPSPHRVVSYISVGFCSLSCGIFCVCIYLIFFKKGQWNTKGICPNKMKGCVQSNYMEPSTQKAALFIYWLAEGISLKHSKFIMFSLKKTAECLEKKKTWWHQQ